jgi:hypothetical protein
MSYPGYPNYNAYYGAPQNDQTQNGYGSSRSQVPNSSYPDPVAYSTEARQTQYPAQEFSWPTNNQQSYTINASDPGQYTEDPYRESSNGQTYDYSRAHASHTGSNKRQAEMQAYSSSASHAPKQPSTQALNELAYASGLESSSLPPPVTSRPVQPPQGKHTPSNAAHAQPRAQVSKLQQSYGNQSQRSPYATQSSYQTVDQNQLAIQAAAALQGLPKVSRPGAASPVVRHAPAAPAPTASQQRSQSPYMTAQTSVTHQRNPSSQSAETQQSEKAGRPNATGPTMKSPTVSTQQSYSVTPNDTRPASAPEVNSIANLVTSQGRQGSPAYSSPTEETTSATFINPREVFNPYHREHERVRREAAAAEAAAKRKAAEDVLKAKYAPPAEPAAAAQPEVANAAAPAKAIKPKNAGAQAKGSGSVPADESDSAAELRQLLARMKELRGKDAALFQKVWDEEKGAPAAKASAASPMSSQQTSPPARQAATPAKKSTSRPSTASRQQAAGGDMPRGFNGYTVVIEDNAEGLPDLGKFPAARRVRYSYASRIDHESPAGAQQQTLPPIPDPGSAAAPIQMPQSGPLVFNPNVAPNSVPMTQALPAREKDGTTIWPAAKRTLLAEQAVIFLKSEPRHVSISISPAEVIAMLDSNPSYSTLCELIEERGFMFDRAFFAKHLITNVPDLSTTQSESQPPPITISAPVEAGGYRPAVPPATFNPPAANRAPPFMNGASIKPETPFQHFRAATPLMHQRNTPLSVHGRARLHLPASQVPAPVPGSKEDMSRKRGFEDLIDLTNEDDDYVVPEKKPRLRSTSPDAIAAFAQEMQPPSQSQSSFVQYGSPNSQGILPTAAAPLRFNTHVLGSSRSEPKQARPPKVMLARKLNKAEALRRNYYDPKTVARDILISTGRHPTERPLNGHLAGLLGNHIELESDLSTLHWEDIDPGGPPPPKNAWSDIPAGPPRFKSRVSETDKAGSAAQMDLLNSRSKVLQKMLSNPARGRVTADPTRGPSLRGPTIASEYAGRFGSGTFSRIKDTAPAPSNQMPRSLAGSSRRNSSPGAARRAEDGLRSLAHQTRSLFNDSFKPPEHRPSGLRQSQVTASEVELPDSQSTPKRSGRPPRQSNLPEATPQPTIEPPPRRGPGRPPRSTASPQVQISPLRPAGSLRLLQRSVSVEKPKMEGKFWPSGKPKGRPPGAKNKIHPFEKKSTSTSVQVVIPPAPAKGDKPGYPVFKCRWIQCGAELHNLATLRKHVAKLHRPGQDIIEAIGYGCYWKKCSLLRQDEDGSFEPTPIAAEEEWVEHINEEHINRIGQKFGDGPATQHIGKQNTPFEAIVSKYFYNPSLFPTDARIVSYLDPQAVASDRTAYLADENGRITTHLADTNDEPDAVILADFYTDDIEANKAAEMAFNSFLRTQGHQKQDTKAAADATLKAMAARKEKIGVGIDRGGCTLVNDERRKTFVQNPGISRIVDEDY